MVKPIDDFQDGDNPFAAPLGDVAAERVVPRTEAEEIRYQYLGHEQYIRALSLLSLFNALVFLVAGIILFSIDPAGLEGTGLDADLLGTSLKVMAVIGLALSAFHLYCGLGLRKYKAAPRVLAILCYAVCGGLSVLAFVGRSLSGNVEQAVQSCANTLLFGACLYVLVNRKARAIFTPEYREVVEQTPYIRPRSGCLPLLVSVAIFFVGGITFAIFKMLMER